MFFPPGPMGFLGRQVFAGFVGFAGPGLAAPQALDLPWIIFAYVHHIVEYLEHEKDPLVREPSTVDLSNALKFLDSEGANALRAHGLQLHKATLREGELMYTPPGMYTLREGLRTL